MINAWDILSEKFNVHKDKLQIDPKAADNILTAWPPMLAAIQSYFRECHGLRALDYGCGTGGFTQQLATLGFETIGMDHSEKMIENAKYAVDKRAEFIVGSAEESLTIRTVDLVSAVMVFQFIEHIEPVFRNLTSILKQYGMLIFAVHNPKYVLRCLEAGMLFSNYDSQKKPPRVMINFETVTIPLFVRTAQEYTEVLRSLNFYKILEEYPPFTSEFLTKYSIGTPTDVPEYLIMAFVPDHPQ